MSGFARSGHGGHPAEVIVVENGSVDGSPDALARRTDIILLENERNLGFASAVNQAYRRSSGEFVLLLNSDVGLDRQALRSMMGFLDAHPTIAGVAPLYVYPDGSPQPFHFRFPTFSVTLANCSAVARRLVPGSPVDCGNTRCSTTISRTLDLCLSRRRVVCCFAGRPFPATTFSTSVIRSSSTMSSLRGRWRRGD